MNSFKIVLEKFDTTLRKYNPVNYASLKEPLTESEIDHYLKALEINDENFKLLYKWKNGVSFFSPLDNRRLEIFDFGILLPLESIVKLVNGNLNGWEKPFIPLISSGDGDFILYNNNKGKDYGKLHLFSAALLFIDEPISYYDSIYKMLETTIEAYEKRIFKYNSDKNFLDQNKKEFHKSAKRNNNLSDFWLLE